MKAILIKCLVITFLFLGAIPIKSQSISNPTIKWKFKTEGTIRGGSVTQEGKIYFGSADGNVYALHQENGRLLWKRATGAAIVSTPTIADELLFISNRDQLLVALDKKTGALRWEFEMQPILIDKHAGWDYFMPSPVVYGKTVYIGSGDGHVYALDSTSGRLLWKYKTNGRIRATPLMYKGLLYQPSNDGVIYVLNATTGDLAWTFETRGHSYNPEDFSFDRSSIDAQPIINNNTLYIGARDGHVYGIDLTTKKEIWNFSYGTTWAMATALSDSMLFVGWSTNNLTCAIDVKDGKELWKFASGGHVYTKPLIRDEVVYIGSADGFLYCLDKTSGKKIWDYAIGAEIYSSVHQGKRAIYFGSDNGYFYALSHSDNTYSAVYQPKNIEDNTKYLILDKKITPYLTQKGFEDLGSPEQLRQFMQDRVKDGAPSVVVFAFPIIPKDILGNEPEDGLMRQYLSSGGKVIWLGDVPNFYSLEASGGFKRDAKIGEQLLGVSFLDASESGNYYSTTTQEGRNMGMPRWMKTTGSTLMPQEGVIPLAFDEYGRIQAWMKKYHKRAGSGFISFRSWAWNLPIQEKDLRLLYDVAVYSLK